MTIKELAEAINLKSKKYAADIAELPSLRKYFLSKSRLPDVIFHERTIFNNENYAFHYGGRDELQFNVAQDYLNGRYVIRFCLAFSLEPSRSLKDPLEVLEPYKNNFNNCLAKYPNEFKNFKMWYYTGIGKNRKASKVLEVHEISTSLFAFYNFIAIGNYIEKPLSQINDNDVDIILNGLDRLLPIYRYCVLHDNSILDIGDRIAKVCWNETDWQYPSGINGKSRDPESHEKQNGYGHEEWLFDFEKLIDGFHYGSLQAVQKEKQAYENRKFNIKLFSRDSNRNQNFWIGSLKNVEVISTKRSNFIYEIYRDQGWLTEMELQIQNVEGNVAKFQSVPAEYSFDIRFKPEDAELYNPQIELKGFEQNVGTYHYQFIKVKGPLNLEEDEDLNRNFKFKAGNKSKSLTTRISKRKKKIVQIEPLHDEIQEKLYRHLLKEYGKQNVSSENDTGLNTRIDITVRNSNDYTLYEIKTYPTVMISIRMALGQLLEYAYRPTSISINELIIVSHLEAKPNDKKYLSHLRKLTGLNIYYQQFDLKNEELLNEP